MENMFSFSEKNFNIIGIKKCRHGIMVYPKNDIYIGRSLAEYGEFSEMESVIFSQIVQPGMIILEAGANIGAHTIALTRAVGEKGFVFAFEPQRILAQMLSTNLILNELSRAKVIQAGLGAEAGSAVMPMLDYSENINFGGISMGMVDIGEEVEIKTIDSLNLSALHFLKIDVEGMEESVLRGAEKTIGSYKPIIYLENDRMEASRSLIEYMHNLGYRLWWHLPPLYNEDNYYGRSDNIFEGIVSINMLCIHKECQEELVGFDEVFSSDERPIL